MVVNFFRVRVFLSALLIGSGILLNSGRAPAKDPILLGVIAGTTGLGSSYGRGIVQGAEMAVRDTNAEGGIHGHALKLLVVDDASNPARSVIAMRRLVGANVALVVGGWGSSQVFAHMDITENAGIPYIVVGATHPGITADENRWTFRVIQTDSVMASQLATLITDTLQLKRIAVLNDSNDYGVGNRDVFIAELAQAGMKPVEVAAYQTSDSDFGVQLRRIAAAKPDSIVIFGTVPAAPKIMNQARALGITARFFGTGGLANEALISLAPKASEGTLLMTHFHPDVDAEASAWAARFSKEFASQTEPPHPILAAWEYRAIRGVAVPCLRSAGPDSRNLRECIARWKGSLFGLSKAAYFNPMGQLVQPPLVVEIQGGAYKLLREAHGK